jgi:hypothetical protein
MLQTVFIIIIIVVVTATVFITLVVSVITSFWEELITRVKFLSTLNLQDIIHTRIIINYPSKYENL